MPSSLFDLPFDITDGERLIDGILPRAQAVDPNFGRGSARSALDHIYTNCKDSCPESRNFDGLSLPVPRRNPEHRPGIVATFESEDVWRCFAPKYQELEEFQNRYNPFRKIKQAVDNCQY